MEVALTHWAPRFIANGVDANDLRDLASAIGRWDEWCAAWSARAAQHEALGRAAAAAGYTLSAGEHLTRAALYFHFAKFLFMHDRPAMRRAHARAVECRRDALPWLQPPGERIELPYLDGRLAGILRRPAGAARPPVVLMAMGLDSAKEEMHAYESTFLARGVATFAFDGPGQGEGEYEFALRGDYEVPVAAVLEWLDTRDDLDRERVAMWGVSLGGYYAPRAAAFHPRLRACIALSGPYDWADGFDARNPLTREAFRIRARCATIDDARAAARTHSLAGVASRIRCPLLVIAGERDALCPPAHARRLAAEASGPVELLLVAEGNHVANNRPYRYRPQSADWLAAQLRA
jgi:2,6-dihydroxypseudooxynicotine hydrolase